MKSIHEQESALFEEWPEHDNALFCPDGLHHTGVAVKNEDYWEMNPDNIEEEKWQDSPLRCIFLTKDHNLQGDEEGVDVRYETGLNNDTNSVYYYFYARYLQLLYGLMHIDLNTFEYPPFEIAQNEDTYLNYFHNAPVVRINTKKIAGTESCPSDVLSSYLLRDQNFIHRQIQIYDANIIIVCQGTGWRIDSDHTYPCHILDMLYNKYPDMKQWCDDNYWIYYSEQTKTIFVHEWHPSKPVSYEDYYEGVQYVAEFLKEHPDYLRK